MTSSPGWHPDPAGVADERYHDGQVWTSQTRTSAAAPAVAPGWYADPAGSNLLRYHDGHSWSERLKDRPDPLRPGVSTALPESTARRLARRSLAQIATDEKALAPTAAVKGTRHMATAGMVAGGVLLAAFAWFGPVSNLLGDFEQREVREELAAAAPVEPAPSTTPAPVVTSEPSQVLEEALEPSAPEAPAPVVTQEAPAPEAAPAPAPSSEAPPFDRNANKPSAPAEGKAMGTIRAPSIGMDLSFVSGTSVSALKKGPGLWLYGSYPGLPGNATLSGHRTTHGAPFRHIDALKYGDRITISLPGQPDAVFEVRDTFIRKPSAVQVTDSVGVKGVRLTLTACDPVGSDAARLVVQAELVEGAWADQSLPREAWQPLG
jgi:LPXTG-site transpeptidase (sortase) family protein